MMKKIDPRMVTKPFAGNYDPQLIDDCTGLPLHCAYYSPSGVPYSKVPDYNDPKEHQCYTGFEGPDSIKDRNGEVCLAMCKVCGLGESELDDNPICSGVARLTQSPTKADAFVHGMPWDTKQGENTPILRKGGKSGVMMTEEKHKAILCAAELTHMKREMILADLLASAMFQLKCADWLDHCPVLVEEAKIALEQK